MASDSSPYNCWNIIVNPNSGSRQAVDAAETLKDALIQKLNWIEIPNERCDDEDDDADNDLTDDVDPSTTAAPKPETILPESEPLASKADCTSTLAAQSNNQPSFRIITTERPLHASEIASQHIQQYLDLQSQQQSPIQHTFHYILIGGDGIIHEVVNGVMRSLENKPDPLVSSIRVVFGVVPCGSGNAVAVSMGISDVNDAIKRIVDYAEKVSRLGEEPVNYSNLQPLLASSVHVAPPPTRNPESPQDDVEWPTESPLKYSNVVVSWGLHAQIVKQSEMLRSYMGNERFRYAAQWNIINLHQYLGSLYTLTPTQQLKRDVPLSAPTPAVTDESGGNSNNVEFVQANPKESKSQFVLFGEKDTSFTYFVSTRMTSLERGFDIAPLASTLSINTPRDPSSNSPCMDLVLAEKLSRAQIIDFLSGALQKGSHIHKPTCKYLKTPGFLLIPSQHSASRSWKEWAKGVGKYHDICVDGEMMKVNEGDAVWVRLLDADRQVISCIQ
ncbi:Sphingosine kinase 2 [Chytridiales sp. JEL 0842]|nr:Sphingosine kinase 2 [Chytridiales sp. JEL 0842]